MKFGCVLNQVQSAYDLNSSLPQYLWVGATESHDQSLSGMLMSVLAENSRSPPLLPEWAGLSPDTLEMSSNRSQVLGILQTGRRCGEFLVSANPLTFNGICFDKAFPIGNSFISLFFTGSLFLLQAFTFNG